MKVLRQHRRRRLNASSLAGSVLIAGLTLIGGCAADHATPPKVVYESGLKVVHVERDPDSTSNSHPVNITPSEIGTLLRGVRTWERRNIVHRLFAGQADKTRAFRDDEIALLAPPLSKALARADPSERVYFHLSHPTEDGLEETSTGWLSVRDSILYLSLSEVHDKHGPGPDISKYDRQMPNVPEVSAPFDVIFEPEEYLVKVRSAGRFYAPDQREELQIRYREALSAMPSYPIKDQRERVEPQP
jgi:hypothetical protein